MDSIQSSHTFVGRQRKEKALISHLALFFTHDLDNHGNGVGRWAFVQLIGLDGVVPMVSYPVSKLLGRRRPKHILSYYRTLWKRRRPALLSL